MLQMPYNTFSNGRTMYNIPTFSIQGRQIFSNWDFTIKICHLATLSAAGLEEREKKT
jgi:hypothetical protein